MVDPEIRDGDRIASLLEAEIQGFGSAPFDSLAFEWAGGESADGAGGESNTEMAGEWSDPEETGGPDFQILLADAPLATGRIQDDRVLLEFGQHQATVADAAESAELRVRPKATSPPSTLVFVERGADVKRVIDVLRESLPPQ